MTPALGSGALADGLFAPATAPSLRHEGSHRAELRRYAFALSGATILWVAYISFDWLTVRYVYPGNFTHYVFVRVLGALILLGSLYVCWWQPPVSRLTFEIVDVLSTTSISGLVSTMALFGAGLESFYAIGVLQVMIYRALALPEHWRRGVPKLIACAIAYPLVLSIASLFSPTLQAQFSQPHALGTFAGNVFALFGTLGLVGLLEHILWSSHEQLAAERAHLERTQTRLVQSEKMASLGVLVAGVAHEINNPVSFIVNNVDPLRELIGEVQTVAADHPELRLAPTLRDMQEIVGVVAQGAQRTARIVSDLRTFSRLGGVQSEPVDVQEGIEVTLRLLRPRWAERIEVHKAYGALPAIEGSRGQLNQVFMHVLANACDAIVDCGNLWVETHADHSRVQVVVRDDGIGIPEEHLGRIFDPFFTTKPQGQGTGLGLSITHGIIADHGGTIRITSRRGGGTEVTIQLPVRAAIQSRGCPNV